MVDSDMEIENENHDAGKCYFASADEWIEDNISWKSENFTGVSGVSFEYNSPQSVSEITELIWGHPK